MTEADSTTTTGGVGIPNLSPRARYGLAVIRERLEHLDNIRSGFTVVAAQVTKALPPEHGLLAGALDALEQAMETPIQEILDELNALAPEGAA